MIVSKSTVVYIGVFVDPPLALELAVRAMLVLLLLNRKWMKALKQLSTKNVIHITGRWLSPGSNGGLLPKLYMTPMNQKPHATEPYLGCFTVSCNDCKFEP
jgi:hypothetical protein